MNIKYNDQIIKIPLSYIKTENIFNYISQMYSKPKLELLISYNGGFISSTRCLSLINIGYSLDDIIEIIDSKQVSKYFNINISNFNQLFTLSINQYTNVFDARKHFATKFLTIPQNIIIKFNHTQLTDDKLLFEYNSTENSPFFIEIEKGYNLYYSFFGQFRLVCLPVNSILFHLKNAILAYSQKNVSIVSDNFSCDGKLADYFKQASIVDENTINQSKIQELSQIIPLFEFIESKKEIKGQNFTISIEFDNRSKNEISNSVNYYSSYVINVYVVKCLLEKDFQIERTLFNLFDKNGEKLSDSDSIGPNCNNKLKLRVDSLLNVKINGEFNQLNYFFSIKELKRKYKFDEHNFGIIINNHFVCENDTNEKENFLINYLNNSNDQQNATNIIIKYSKNPCHEIMIKSKKKEKDDKMIFIISDNFKLEQIANLYLHQNIDSVTIEKKGNNCIEYSNKACQIVQCNFFVDNNLNYSLNIEINEENPRIIDLLKNIYKYSDKKIKIKKKFDVFDASFNQKKLYFWGKVANILYNKVNKISIHGFSYQTIYKSKKINIIDYINGDQIEIKYQALSSQEIINELINKKKIKCKNPKLFLDFNELEMKDMPTLYMKDDLFLILNDVTDQKSLFVSNGTSLQIQIRINKIQYSSIAEIIKSIFNLKDEKVDFICKIKNDVFKLPPKFDAAFLPENSLILIIYGKKITNEITFSIDRFSLRQKIELSNINLPLNELKQEIQSKLNFFDYSLKSFDFYFHEYKLDASKRINDYKINFLTINVSNDILVSIIVKEKSMQKHFSKDETINDVRNNLRSQFKIDDYCDLLNENNQTYDLTQKLYNNMIINLHCKKNDVFSTGSIGNRIFNISCILSVSEGIQYICKEIQKSIQDLKPNEIAIFCRKQNCFSEVDLNKKLYEFEKLFVHKIVTNITFGKISLNFNQDRKISECNSVQYLIDQFIAKSFFMNPKNIIIKKNNQITDSNITIYDLLKSKEDKLEIVYKSELNKQKIDEIQIKQKQKIIEKSEKINETILSNESTNEEEINNNNEDVQINPTEDNEIKQENTSQKVDNSDTSNEEEQDEEDNDELFKELRIPIFDPKDYKIIKDIGEGQYGKVKLVENKKTHNIYAAKVAFNDNTDKENKKRIMMEIKSQVIGENAAVLKLIGISFKDFENDNSTIILTEYMKNDSLLKQFEDESNFSASHDFTQTKKYIILLGISLGMKYLHFQGIIHRDLKPANILIDENFYPHICDFGYSFVSNVDDHMTNIVFKNNCGTPYYMAPEVINSENYTYKADVFSYSLIAYEILTGKKPYPTKINVFSLFKNILSGKRPDLSLIKDENICKFLSKCWDDDPSVRPTFNDIVEEVLNERYRKYFEADEDEVEEYLDLFSVSLKTYNCDIP